MRSLREGMPRSSSGQHGVDLVDRPLRPEVGDIERLRRVAHPEVLLRGLAEHEDHSLVPPEVHALHEAALLLPREDGHLQARRVAADVDREMVPHRLQRRGGLRRLAAAGGRDRKGENRRSGRPVPATKPDLHFSRIPRLIPRAALDNPSLSNGHQENPQRPPVFRHRAQRRRPLFRRRRRARSLRGHGGAGPEVRRRERARVRHG